MTAILRVFFVALATCAALLVSTPKAWAQG